MGLQSNDAARTAEIEYGPPRGCARGPRGRGRRDRRGGLQRGQEASSTAWGASAYADAQEAVRVWSVKQIYLRKGQTSVLFDRVHHNFEAMIADGWIEYDPLQPGDARCTDTHRRNNLSRGPATVVCMHGHSWWCPRAPEENWYPDAPYERDRALVSRLRGPRAA